ncbi:MAG: hypothetical protein Q7J16_04460 [Candidatus Cloacimonadales bacterium]|nr:hypothetical protein [Candidatus Cloacimonadales bacterium]
MKSDFREEIARRKQERRRQSSNTWVNMFLRILLFAAIIIVIRHFGKIRAEKIGVMLQSHTADTTEVIEDK